MIHLCYKIKTMEKNNNFRNSEAGRIVGGLILVAAGAFLLLRNMGVFLPGWLFSWPIILILVGIYSGFKHNFRNNSWLIMIAVGVFFLVDKFIPSLSLEPLFWPLVIIGLGVAFILRPRKSKWEDFKKDTNYNQWKSVPGSSFQEPAGDTPANIDSNDFLVARSVFSGIKRNVVTKNFQGGNVSCIFGGAEFNLTQVDFTGQVVLKLEMIFGGSKFIIPSNWTVQNEIDGVFHGVEDKRKWHSDSGSNPAKILILRGSAVFGGIEITSY